MRGCAYSAEQTSAAATTTVSLLSARAVHATTHRVTLPVVLPPLQFTVILVVVRWLGCIDAAERQVDVNTAALVEIR